MKDMWPTSWLETENIFKKVGYEFSKAILHLHELRASKGMGHYGVLLREVPTLWRTR